jgi:hydrogenase nickel incorporation protein HypA/HybF
MHEMGITQSLLDMSVGKAREAGASAVKRINLVIGDMSSVLDDSVQFYFDFISQGTIAEGAKLIFKRIPIKARCRQCGAEFSPGADSWKCPQCQDLGIEIIAGSEFYMESIEVEG